jgi:hypothetical protein
MTVGDKAGESATQECARAPTRLRRILCGELDIGMKP